MSTLRTALSALENAEAVPTSRAGAIEQAPVGAGAAEAARRVLSDADELALLDEEIVSLQEAGRVSCVRGARAGRGRASRCWRCSASCREP